MAELDRHAILREMGITQWILRDGPADPRTNGNPEPSVEDEPELAPEPVEHEPTAEPTSEPVHEPVVASVKPETVPVAVSLASLRVEVDSCSNCELAKTRTNTVFGEGPEQADWLFIGEAPGQQEDLQGRPFVGRAGTLLTQMLRALGQSPEQVFIANTLKCRPPDNRDPLPHELQACEPFLLKQIELVQPKVIVALGRFSAQTLVGEEQSLAKLRGQVYHYGPARIPLIVTYHPAYLLRQPGDKAKVWSDLLLAHRQLPV